MTGGLVAGYGAFAAVSIRYLYPTADGKKVWLFVTDIDRFRVGDSLVYTSPTGATVAIARQANAGSAEDFIALSSVCPHLGCQVHWEGQNNRFFCPCHNGTFDKSGKATGGPPGEAGQSLSRFPLRLEKNLLFIEVSTEGVAMQTDSSSGRYASAPANAGAPAIVWDGRIDWNHSMPPGHDACLRGSRAPREC
jgi:Rieske Fe-S protein